MDHYGWLCLGSGNVFAYLSHNAVRRRIERRDRDIAKRPRNRSHQADAAIGR